MLRGLMVLLAAMVGVLDVAGAEPDPVRSVDPFIGVDGGGATFPGAVLPFGMVSVSPDTVAPQETSGYRSNQPILGFSHTHSSGTGGDGRYGNILLVPQIGPPDPDRPAGDPSAEVAGPGYYAVTLQPSGIRAEMTAAARAGLHRYTFPTGAAPRILIDASATRDTRPGEESSSHCKGVDARIVSPREITGWADFEGGWGGANPHRIYFVATFDRDMDQGGAWSNGAIDVGSRSVSAGGEGSIDAGLCAAFAPSDDNVILVKVGLSHVSLDNARAHQRQIEGWDFAATRTAAETVWREHLNRIEVTGGTPAQRTVFYTALYHSLLLPRDLTGDNPLWTSDAPHYWDFYCIWDTFRTTDPLRTLILPDRQRQIVRTLLDMYQQRGWLPDSWVGSSYGDVQGGSNADVVLADAVVKNLGGFDAALALQAMRKHATQQPTDTWHNGRFADVYNKHHYIPADKIKGWNSPPCGTSRTLEYAYNDFCIAQVAAHLGEDDVAQEFLDRSRWSLNLFHPEYKMFWARTDKGEWLEGFDPDLGVPSWEGPFYEGSPWQYSTNAPHLMNELIERHGGPERFVAFLDEFFDGHHFYAGNEPDIMMPWQYVYAGRPDKAARRVRDVLQHAYRPTRDGLPGNDDAGAISSWAVFAMMGFYPVAGQDLYLLASPSFERITLHLGDDAELHIVARNLSEQNIYVQSATLHGEAWDQAWFRHSDIADGGELVLEMGPKPSDWGRATPPPSFEALLPPR